MPNPELTHQLIDLERENASLKRQLSELADAAQAMVDRSYNPGSLSGVRMSLIVQISYSTALLELAKEAKTDA